MLEDYEYSFPKNPKDRMKDGAVMFVLSLVLAGICALTTSGEVFQLAALALVFGLIFSGFGIFEMLRGWYSHRRQTQYEPLSLCEQDIIPFTPAKPLTYEDWFLSEIVIRGIPQNGMAYFNALDEDALKNLWEKSSLSDYENWDFSDNRFTTITTEASVNITLVWARKPGPEKWPPEN